VAGLRGYGFHLAAGIFQSCTKSLPLLPSLGSIN